MPHYSKEALESYRHGGMSVLGRIACATHLKKCPLCREKMNALERDDRLILDLRRSVEIYSGAVAPSPTSKRN